MMFTVGRLVSFKLIIGIEVINEAGFNNAFYFRNNRKVRD